MDKKLIRNILPPVMLRFLSGVYYGWHGNYASWEEASEKCSGYDSKVILDRVRESAIKVKNGEAVYERDSVIFDEIQYSFPVLSILLWIALKNKGKLNIIDFGGSLGTTYFQNKQFLDAIPDIKWCVVEQPSFVNTGKEMFENDRLHFFSSIDECMHSFKADAIIFSSVLQYLEKPFGMPELAYSAGIKYLIVDRTPFIKGKDRITIQRVNPKIYKAAYPCWFFNEDDFLSRFQKFYKLVFGFEALDRSNIQSDFLGFLFERTEEIY